jgi:uncharacterized protein (TIGR02646 family)
MRWVDLDQLELPDGWPKRSDQALNELRAEVNNAELEAQRTGGNVQSARKKAISDGLDKSNRKKIWRDLAPRLGKLQKGKCWYSESKNSGSDKDIDHFRPKNRVDEDPDHEGYWWLAFDWRNYRYSCQWCNQRRNDAANKTDGGKWDHFPISPQGCRAQKEGDKLALEEVDLLDPIDPEDWKLLTFLPNGQPTPAKDPGTREYERAKTSIQVYHLHCVELVRDRKNRATEIRLLVEDMETLYSKITEPEMRELYKNQQKKLLRFIDSKSEYSAAALAYAKAEIYKTDCGRQAKRQWLEDILNLSP